MREIQFREALREAMVEEMRAPDIRATLERDGDVQIVNYFSFSFGAHHGEYRLD